MTLADQVGSTDFIIRAVEAVPSGIAFGIAMEIHLVQRLAPDHPDETIMSPDPPICPCLGYVPHRRGPPSLGAGEPGRRTGGEPDHRGRGDGYVGEVGTGPDAGDRLIAEPVLQRHEQERSATVLQPPSRAASRPTPR